MEEKKQKENLKPLNVQIPEELKNRFSDTARLVHGRQHGYLKKATIEALELWLAKNEK